MKAVSSPSRSRGCPHYQAMGVAGLAKGEVVALLGRVAGLTARNARRACDY